MVVGKRLVRNRKVSGYTRKDGTKVKGYYRRIHAWAPVRSHYRNGKLIKEHYRIVPIKER